jgi:hypothetical protein
VALRNDSTRTKIQLLTGRDLLGSEPHVESQSAGFWIGWIVLLIGPGSFAIGIVDIIFKHVFDGNAFLAWLGNALCILLALGMVLGIPYGCIVHPRLRRAAHNRRVKAADAAIAKIFNPL